MREYTEEEIQHTKYLDDMLTYYGKMGCASCLKNRYRITRK